MKRLDDHEKGPDKITVGSHTLEESDPRAVAVVRARMAFLALRGGPDGTKIRAAEDAADDAFVTILERSNAEALGKMQRKVNALEKEAEELRAYWTKEIDGQREAAAELRVRLREAEARAEAWRQAHAVLADALTREPS